MLKLFRPGTSSLGPVWADFVGGVGGAHIAGYGASITFRRAVEERRVPLWFVHWMPLGGAKRVK